MKLIKGLVTDLNDIDFPEGAWKYARNMMYVRQGALSNELGFNRLFSISGKILIGNIPLPDDSVILFYVNENPEVLGNYLGSEIGILRPNNTYSTLVLNNALNFNPNYPINGKFKYNNSRELIIVFTDFFNPPRLINLKTTNNPIVLTSEKDYMLFLNLQVSKISSMEVRNGGNLVSGSYQFAFRYKFKDGSVTGVYFISNPVPIYASTSSIYEEIEGDEGGRPTSKSIRIGIEDIDTDYEKLMVYVIRTVNQVTTADLISEYSISSNEMSVVYTGTQGTPVALSEILTSFSSYTKVKKFEVHQDWLFAANVSTPEISMNYQAVANNIIVKWNSEDSISLNRLNNSYKDPTTVFIKRGFMPGEVYAFYIRFILKNGQRSTAYHIPGRNPLAGERDNVTFTYLQRIDPTAKNFHLLDTAQQDGSEPRGLMGYWENENEMYPNDSSLWGSRANQPVRHHKFPSLSFLKENVGDFISIPDITTVNTTPVFNNDPTDNSPDGLYVAALGAAFLDSTFALSGVSGQGDSRVYPQVSYIVPETESYNFELDINLTVTETASQNVSGAMVRLNIYSGTEQDPLQNNLAIRNTILNFVNGTLNVALNYEVLNLPLQQGDRVTVLVQLDLPTSNNEGYTIQSQNITLDIEPSVDPEEFSTNGNILGIELSNINVPDAVRELVQGYEILYARRGLENSQIVGQGYLTPQNWFEGDEVSEYNKEGRFFSFDMLSQKPATGSTHIKMLAGYGLNGAVDILNVDGSYNDIGFFQRELWKVNGFEYIPNNNSAVDPTNLNREEHIRLRFADDFPSDFDPRSFICELHSLKKDVYLSFDQQVLVSTGIIHPISLSSSVQQTGLLFGGDTFLSPYGINMHHRDDNTFTYKTVNIWSYSAGNIGLRVSQREWNRKYFPIADVLRNRWERIADEEIPPETDLTDTAEVRKQKEILVMRSTDLYLYNIDYSRLNTLVQTFVFLDEIPVKDYPFRLIRGLPSLRESDVETWRNFPAFDYYEMPKEKGEIWNIASIGSVLLIHQKYMLYRTRGNGVLRTQSNEEIQLGEGDILDFRPDEVIPLNLSYAGTQSMYASIVCKMGYVFVDGSQGRVFVYSSELKEISNKFMLNWFNDNFIYTGTDNPYLGQGFAMGYDNRFNRLILTLNRPGFNRTISFSSYIDSWISYHTYLPSILIETPNKLFSVERYTGSSSKHIFVHNVPDKRGIYYDQDTPQPSIVDAVSAVNQTMTKKTVSVSWIADRLRNGILQRDKTFTGIFLHNSFQATEFRTLTHYDFVSGTVRNIKNSWNFDFIRNISNGGVPINDQGNINSGVLNPSKPWFEQEEFEDKYVVIRLVYDNQIIDGVQEVIYLYDVSANDLPIKR